MKLILFVIVFLAAIISTAETAYATEASLKCSPSTGTFKVGDSFSVDYTLDTRTFPVYGADIIATFDTGILEAVGTQSTPVTTSTNWGQPATNTIDSVLGKITLEYGKTQPAYTGSSSIGQITFRAKVSGQAQFNYTFFQQYDDTTPGVAKVWGKRDGVNLTNILTDVNNCIYVIEGTTTPTTAPSQPTPTLAPGAPTNTPLPQQPAPTISELPRSGSMETTISFLGIATLLVTIGTATAFVVLKHE